MKNKVYLFLIIVACSVISLYSQPKQPSMYCRGGLFPSAYLQMSNIALPNGAGNDYTWISPVQAATSNGNYNLAYSISSSTKTAGTYWGDKDATVKANTPITFLVSTADAHWVIVSGKKYVFTMQDVASGTNATGYIFEFGGTPSTIASVANSAPSEISDVTITATLSAAPVTNQVVYVRWATSSTFANSTVTQMSGSGTTLTATIPAQVGGTTVYYYCFSSGVTGLTAATCNPATINVSSTNNYSVAYSNPALTVAPVSLTGFTYVQGNGPSASQSYSLSGVLLSGYPGNVAVTAPADFEVSLDNTTFSSAVEVPFPTATLPATKIYVRLKAGLAIGKYEAENISNAGGGIAAVTVACTGTVTLTPPPAFALTPSSLTGFAYIAGQGPSSVKSFKISGTDLEGFPGNITVTASTDYQVSTDTANFVSTSVTIPFTAATLGETSVYVRLKSGLAAASYSEAIAIAGGGATASLTCNGAVSAPASQVLKWTPSIITESDAVTITFDATQGSAGLKGYTGDVYAHTGVLTDKSINSADWKCIKTTWGTNTADTKLTRIGTDLYQFVINPSVRSYYGVAAGDTVKKICLVFRSASSPYLEGKDVGAADLFVPVAPSGMNVLFTAPTTFPIIKNINEQQQISVVSSNSTQLSLYADTALIAKTSGTSLNYTFTCSYYGKVWIKAVATDGTNTKADSFYVIVRPPATVQAVPAGIVDGINYISPTSVVLCLYAPLKKYVHVIGDFSKWQVDPAYYMNVTSDSTRYWVQINNLSPGNEYGYQYLVDGNLNVADPYADKILDLNFDKDIKAATYPDLKPYPTGLTTQMVSVLQTAQGAYSWKTTSFTKPPKDNLVVYELLVRDFVSTHSFKGLIDTIGYFKNLGINAIELMPVNEFDMNESWGYNPDFMFAVDKYYGPKNDLKAFIDKCHENGIAVIFDAVLNHQTGNSPFARLWWDAANNQPAANNPYFNVVAPHPYSVYNDLNHESTATKYFVDRFLKYWLSEYKFDGYRFDLSKGYTQTASTEGTVNNFDQSRVNNLTRMYNSMKSVDTSAYLILEHFCNNDEETALSNLGIMVWTKLSDNYAAAAQGTGADLTWGSYKARGFGAPNAVAYMESHDEDRLMYRIESSGSSSGSYNTKTLSTALDRVKLDAAFFIPIPGPKMIWMFGELGYDVTITYNGRDGVKPLHWEYYSDAQRQKLFRTFKYLNMLKTAYPAFRSTNYTTDLTGTLKKINITDASMNIHIIGNFGLTAQSITCNFQNTGTWYDYFTGASVDVTNKTMSYPLQPGEFHILTTVQLPVPNMVTAVEAENAGSDRPKEFSLGQNYPNPFNPSTVISYQLPQDGLVTLKVYNVLGKEVATLVNQNQNAGTYKVTFDGSHLASGVYFYRMDAGSFSQSRKLLLIK